MRAKEALLKNFFANVDVVLRTQKVAATSQRWEVRRSASLWDAGCMGRMLGALAARCWLQGVTGCTLGALAGCWAYWLPCCCVPWPPALQSSSGGCIERSPGMRLPTFDISHCHQQQKHQHTICNSIFPPTQEEERQLQRELDAAQRRVHEALCDNINTQVGCTGHAGLKRAFQGCQGSARGACHEPPGGIGCPSTQATPGAYWTNVERICLPPCCANAPTLQAAMGALCDLVKAANIYLAARQDAAGGLLKRSWCRMCCTLCVSLSLALTGMYCFGGVQLSDPMPRMAATSYHW